MLSDVLYEYETWSRSLREEYTLRVLESTCIVLRRKLGPKKNGVTGG